jgi:hypothetical protein
MERDTSMEPGVKLKGLKLKELEPDLQREVVELVHELEPEATINAESDLHFLVMLYKAEAAREKASAERLEKATDLIMRLSSLHHEIVRREGQRRKEETGKRVRLTLIEGGAAVSKRTRELLASIGVEDENVVIHAEERFGEKGVESRVEAVGSSLLPPALVKNVFREHPELILIPAESEFHSELEAMEYKKEMLDNWRESHGMPLPIWADYEKTPGILTDSYHDINRQLGIVAPEERREQPAESARYVPRTMKKREMLATLAELGYRQVRKVKELVFEGPRGRTLTTSDPHNGEYGTVTVRRIIRDLGITPNQFEEARKKLRGE